MSTTQDTVSRSSHAVATSATAPFDEPTLGRLQGRLSPVGLDFEIEFYEQVRRRDPDHEPALEALGHAYTQRGLHERGLEVDRHLADRRPKDAIVQYNLACSYVLVGDTDLGIATLARAVELGYDDLEHLEKDRDLDPLRGDRRFQAIVQKLR